MAANTKNVHVVQRGNKWGTLHEGGSTNRLFDTQGAAIKAGREQAAEGRGSLLIHGRDGQIREKNSYVGESSTSKGKK